jgi:gliding motility-associated-like protein
MKHFHIKIITIVLSFLVGFSTHAQLTVSFSSTPASSSGTLETCLNSSVSYTSTSTNIPPGATILWEFPGGEPENANTLGPHEVNYNTPGSYTATLTIDGVSSTINVEVSNNLGSPELEIANFLTFAGYIQDTLNSGEIYIAYCEVPGQPYNSLIQYDFTIATYPADHTILVDWGDGAIETYPGNIGSLSHIYDCSTNNLFSANVTVVSPGGCVASQSYPIFSGLSPQMSITGNLSSHCNPEPYTFVINSNDIPGTTFELLFSENGAAPVQFAGPFPLTFEYIFGEHSCGQTAVISGPGGVPITYANAYAANLLAENYCGSSFLSIGPIYVGDPPNAIMEMTPEDFACVGENVIIENISELGITTGPTGCNPVNRFYWQITPNTGYTINAGTLGNGTNPNWVFWTSGSQELDITFNEFGTYYIQLIQANGCGRDTIIDSICIVAPIEADFTTDLLEGCTPFQLTTDNTPYIPSCFINNAEYEWSVTSIGSSNCPNQGAVPNFIAGTEATSFEPIFLFISPGEYEIQLIASLTNPIPGTLCVADTQTVTINVGQGPNLFFDTYEICQNDTITISNSIEDCYSGINIFDWSFGGNPPYISSDTVQTPSVSFDQFGTFPISVEMTNNCSTATFNSFVTVIPEPTLNINIPIASCINTDITLEAIVGGSASQGVWTVTPNLGTIVSPNANTSFFIPPNGFTGTLTFTFTTTDAHVLCGQISETAELIYELNATTNAGTYAASCEDTPLQLNGVFGGAASSITWSSNVGGTFSDLNDVNSTYTPPSGYIGSVVLTITTDDPPGTCTAASANATIEFVETPEVTVDAPLIICEGQSILVNSALSGNASGVAWGSDFGTFTDINASSTIFTPNMPFNGTASLYVFSTGSTPCPVDSAFATITVEPIPVIADTLITICNGDNFSLNTALNPNNIVPVNTEFTWTISSNPSITGASNQTVPTSTLAQTLNNTSNAPQSIVYTVIPEVSNSLNCVGLPFSITVNVIPTPSVDVVPNQAVCEFEDVNISFSGTATQYQWTNTTEDIGLPASGIGNLSFVALNGTTNQISSVVIVAPEYELNGLTCFGNATSFSIQVTPAPDVNIISDLSYCVGDNVPTIIFSSPTAGTSFLWTNNNNLTGLTENGNSQTPSFIAANNSNLVQESVVSVIGISNACPSLPMEFSLFVLPTPTINSIADLTFCDGENSSLVEPLGTATDFAWTNNNIDIGLGANDMGNIPVFLTSNTTANPISGLITVTPEYTFNGLTCFGTPTDFTINIAPEPIVDGVADIVACNGDNIPQTTFTGNPNAYVWNLTGSPVGSATNGTGNLLAFTAENLGNSPIDANVEVTPQYEINGITCNGIPETFSITVNHTPITDVIDDITACDNNILAQVDISGTGTSYVWSASGGTIGLVNTAGNNFIEEFTSINNGVTNNVSTITITPEFTGSGLTCVGNPSSFQYIILPVTEVDAVPDAEYCSNEPSDEVVFSGSGTSYNWTNDNTDIGLAASGTGNLAVFTTSNSTAFPIQGELEVTPILTENGVSCGGIPTTFIIVVNPAPIVDAINDTTVCVGEPLDAITITGTATSYTWSNDNTETGLGVSGVDLIPGFTSQNISNSLPAVSMITIIPNFAGGVFTCPGATSSFTITVNPTPEVNAVGDIVLCDDETANPVIFNGTATSYTWTNSQTSIGIGADGVGNTPTYTAINTSNEPVLANVEVTPVFTNNAVSCAGSPTNFSITVNPQGQVNPIDDVLTCNDLAINPILFTTTNLGGSTAYDWTNDNTSFGLGASDNNITSINGFTVDNDLANVNTANIQVTPIYSNAGLSCPGPPTAFQIQVLPTPSVTALPDLTFCVGENSSLVEPSGTATDFAWTNNNTDIGLGANETGNIPVFLTSNTTANPISGLITVSPEFTFNGLTCFGAPTDFNITIAPEPIVDAVADIVACNGDIIPQTTFTGNPNAYDWNFSGAAVGSATSGTGNLPSFTGINTGDVPIVANVEITPQYEINGITCNGTPQTFSITVNHTPSTDVIDDITACHNSLVPQVDISGTGTNYVWSAGGGAIGLVNIDGNNFIEEFTSINNGVTNNVSSVTITPEFTGSGLTCIGSPSSFQYIILPVPVAVAVADAEYCSNEPSSEVVFSGSGTSYNWTNDNTNIGLTASGTGNVPVFTTSNNTAFPIQGEIEVTPILTENGVSCSGLPIIFNIVINPSPQADPINDTTICVGEPLNLVNITGTGTSYSWVNNNTSTGLAGSGNNFIPAFTAQNPSNSIPASSLITITPNFAGGMFTCPGVTTSFTVTVNPTPIVDAVNNIVLCDDETANPVVFGGTASAYNWTNSQTSIGLGADGIGNTPTYTATNNSNEPVLANVQVTPVFTNNAVSCPGLPTSFSITINPIGQVNPIDNVLTCNDLTINPILFTTNNLGGSTTYNWTNNNTSFGLGASGNNITSINGFTVDNDLANVNTANIQVTPIYTNAGLSCPGPLTTFQIQVLPTPTVGALPDYTYCFNSPTNVSNFTGVATNYAWTNNNTDIGLAGSGNGNIPVFTTSNPSGSAIQGILVVTPQYEFSGLTCFGDIMDFMITVAPDAVVTPIDDLPYCNGETIPDIIFTGTSNTFIWNFSGANIGNTLSNGNTFIPGFNAVNNGLTPLTTFVTVNSIFNINNLVCTGTSMNFNIFVNPTPMVNPTADIDDCHNTVVNTITFTGTGNNYAWTSTNPSIGLNSPNGNNAVGSFTMFNVSPVDNVSDIIVTPQYIANGITCNGTTDTFNILVHLTPQVDFIPNQNVCNGVITSPISFSGTGNTFTWTNNNPGIGLPSSGNGNINAFEATNPFALPIQGVVTVSPSLDIGGNICPGIPSSFSIQVNPSPVVNQVNDLELCTQNLTSPIGFLGTATSYQWFNNNTTIGLSPSGTNTIPAFFAQSTPFGANIANIDVVPLFQGPDYTCVGDTMSFNITVLPTPAANLIPNQTICNNDLSTEVIISGNGTDYEWFCSNANIGSTVFGNDIIPSFIGTNDTGVPQSATFTITPFFNGNGFQCVGNQSSFTITVIPTPTIDPVPNEVYCNGINAPQLDYTGAFTQVQWTNNNTSIGLISSGITNLPSFVTNNPSNSNAISAVITAAPFYVLNGVSCSGQPALHQIEVLPLVSVSPVPDQAFCAGDLSPALTIVSSGNSISWISSNPTIGLGSGFTNAIPAFNTINGGNNVETTTVTITPSFINTDGVVCVGQIEEYTITVNPTPVFDPQADLFVCNNAPIAVNFNTSVPSNIVWSASGNPNIPNIFTNDNFTPFINQTPNNISSQAQEYTYNASLTSLAGCVGSPISFDVTVMPNIIMTSQNFTEICSDTPVDFFFESNVASQFVWVGADNIQVNNISTSLQTGSVISDILNNSSSTSQLVVYQVTPTSILGACEGVAQTVTVNVVPAPLLLSPQVVEICNGNSVDYTFQSNADVTYSWIGQNNPNVSGITTTNSNTSQINDLLSFIGNNPQSVNYNVILTNSFNTNCSSNPIQITALINPLPFVNSQSFFICSNDTLDIQLSASQASTFTWNAQSNNNVLGISLALQNSSVINDVISNLSNVTPQTVIYNVVPTSIVTGCSGNTTPFTVTVNPIPLLDFDFPSVLCSGTPITVINNSPTNATYFWDFGNGSQSIDYQPTTIFNNTGVYDVSLTGTYLITGCSSTLTQSVFIGDTPPIDFIASDYIGCMPVSVTFTNTTEIPGSTVVWAFGDGGTSNEQINADHYYDSPGCFDVTMTLTTAQGCVSVLTYEEMVCSYPTPEALFYVPDPVQLSVDNEFTMVNLSQNGYLYQWDLGDGTMTNAFEPIHSYPDEHANYIITLVVINEAGCTDTAYTQVQVIQKELIYVPNTFIPDGNNRNDVFTPILTAGFIPWSYEFFIFNRWGEVVFSSNTIGEGWDGTYQNNLAPDGTYVWKIRVLLYDEKEQREYYGHVNLLR